MKEEFEFDEDLEKSIANIVDEETADAQLYVNEKYKTEEVMPEIEATAEADTVFKNIEEMEEAEDEEAHISTKKIIIIVAIIVVCIAAITISAVLVVKSLINKSKENYAYYNNMGYIAYDKEEYDEAIENFEKALTFPEGSQDDKDNIDMMLWLYEAYKKSDNKDMQIDILERIIDLDSDNYNALYNLTSVYDADEDYAKIKELYESVKNSDNEDVVTIFSKYMTGEPYASPEAGTYSDDQKIFLGVSGNCKVYYTTNGNDPKENASIYTDKIEIKEGTTTIKFYAINEYGFESDVVEAEYKVEYGMPETPVISPKDTTIEQNSKVMVTIGNIASDSVAYYTIDGTTPTTSSSIYAGPFELPSGTVTVKVMVVDSHGNTVSESKTYKIKYIPKHTREDAEEAIWNALIKSKEVDKKHNDKDGMECQLKEYGEKEIEGKTMHLFYYYVDGEKQDYFYGADINSDTCVAYKVTQKDKEYTLKKLK